MCLKLCPFATIHMLKTACFKHSCIFEMQNLSNIRLLEKESYHYHYLLVAAVPAPAHENEKHTLKG